MEDFFVTVDNNLSQDDKIEIAAGIRQDLFIEKNHYLVYKITGFHFLLVNEEKSFIFVRIERCKLA